MKIKPINLSPVLKKYKSGWVAFDKKYRFVAHAKSFKDIMKKTNENPEHILFPAAESYKRFIT